MPIKNKLRRSRPPVADNLARMLIDEWRQPKEQGQPLIILDRGDPEPLHVYVIWDAWNGLNQIQRSEIIFDVLESLPEPNRLKWPVTLAMGLTSEEAKRMGIEGA